MSPVTFLNSFDVPADADEEFLALWTEVNAYMSSRPGYLSHRLHRAIQPDARYRYVNVVQWESHEAWAAGHDETFRRLVSQSPWRRFPSMPALYEVVHDSAPDNPRIDDREGDAQPAA